MGPVSEPFTVLIKPGATDQPGIVELLSTSDTGVMGDGITSNNTPTLRVPLPVGVVLGDQVRIYGTFASTSVLFSISVTQDQITAGRVDIQIPSTMPLPDGAYSFRATILDAAGNESQKSLLPYGVIIDTQGPTAPSAFSLALMASPNSPTHGHPKFPQAAPSDYDPSAWMAKRAAASLSL
jgi:hypothetical protein